LGHAVGFTTIKTFSILGSDVLLKVTVPLQPSSKCERIYNFNKASQICAGEGGKDSCQVFFSKTI
jgi:hypothetical protein